MGKEFIGSSIMSLGGFFLMVAIEGKILETILRLGILFLSFLIFYIGMKFYRKYSPKESLTSKDWLIIILSLLTPFVVVSLLESLGMILGMMGIFIWLDFTVIVTWKTERVIDLLFPRIKKKPVVEKTEELRRRFNPELYTKQVEKKKENKLK